jgi:uncharacterized repeat protein (TIGR02543 family)
MKKLYILLMALICALVIHIPVNVFAESEVADAFQSEQDSYTPAPYAEPANVSQADLELKEELANYAPDPSVEGEITNDVSNAYAPAKPDQDEAPLVFGAAANTVSYTYIGSNPSFSSSSTLSSGSSLLNTYVKGYYFYGTTGRIARIAMNSSAIDPYLYLLDSSYNVLDRDDDDGGYPNSLISYTLPYTGYYYIQATEYSTASGSYTISVEVASTYTLHYNANGGSNAPEDQRVNAGSNITLSSTIPIRAGYVFMGWSSSSSASSASYRPGNTYSISGSATIYAVWGSYQSINLPVNTSGTLSSSDGYSQRGSLMDGYRFSGSTGEYIEITMSSSTIDPYIYLLNSSGTVLAYNDDYNGLSSYLGYRLTSGGTYYVVATSYSYYAGSYTIRISSQTPTYTVSYNANGGTGAPSSQTANSGQQLVLRSDIPRRTGYLFAGWSSSSNASTASFLPGGNYSGGSATLYAVWNSGYAVSPPFSSYGAYRLSTSSGFSPAGARADIFGFNVVAGNALTVTMNSNNFDCFLYLYNSSGVEVASNDDGNGGLNSKITYTPASAGRYYAVATGLPYSNPSGYYDISISQAATTFTVSYNANGGSGAPASQTKTQGVTLYLSSTRPTRTGYNFSGWATSSSATQAQYQPGGAYTNNASATLYAVWQQPINRLTYNANGGSGEPSPQTGTSVIISSVIPTRFPYTFLGWSTSSNSSSPSYNGGNTITLYGNTTLYAVWQSAATMTLGTGYTTTVGFSGKMIYYRFVPPSTRSYVFTSYNQNGSTDPYGYIYSQSGSQIAYNDDSGGTVNYKITCNLTAGTTYYLGAKCYSGSTGTYTTKVSTNYAISFNANGGSGAPSAVNKEHGTTLLLPSTMPIRDKYNFAGWSTSASATSASYSAGGSFTANADTVLYAVWLNNGTYSVTYDANGGTGAPTSQTKQQGVALTLRTDKPTKSGYSFSLWLGSDGASYQSGASFSGNYDLRLVAQYTATSSQSFDMRFDAWNFINYETSFGYSYGYRVPKARFVTALGAALADYYYNLYSTWGGSCFGMSATSSMFFFNNPTFKLYYSSYNHLIDVPRPASPTNNTTKLIEVYQVIQFHPTLLRIKSENASGDKYQKLVNALSASNLQAKNLPIISARSSSGSGHAIVAYGISETSTEWDIKYYNNWYAGSDASHNAGDHMYINKSTKATRWSDPAMSLRSYSYYSYTSAQDILSTMLSGNIFDSGYVTLAASTENVSILDDSGNAVSDDFKVVPMDGSFNGVVYFLPEGEYSVQPATSFKAASFNAASNTAGDYSVSISDGNTYVNIKSASEAFDATLRFGDAPEFELHDVSHALKVDVVSNTGELDPSDFAVVRSGSGYRMTLFNYSFPMYSQQDDVYVDCDEMEDVGDGARGLEFTVGEESILYGDFNGDGAVTAADATWILRYVASGRNLVAMIRNYPTTIPSSQFKPENADFDNNGNVSAADATWVLRYVASQRNRNNMTRNYPTTINFNHLPQ